MLLNEMPEALRKGWQKTADATGLAVHVFRNARGQLLAVTNRAHGAGEWLETLVPAAAVPVNADAVGIHGLGAMAGRTSHGEAG